MFCLSSIAVGLGKTHAYLIAAIVHRIFSKKDYVVTFIIEAGMKFNEDFYEKVANASGIIEEDNLSTYAIDDKQLACTYAPNKACGDRCLDVKSKKIESLKV